MNVRLDEDEVAGLRRVAAKTGQSVQQAARLAIHEWVERMTMAGLIARPPLGGGRIPPGTSARLLRQARAESGRG